MFKLVNYLVRYLIENIENMYKIGIDFFDVCAVLFRNKFLLHLMMAQQNNCSSMVLLDVMLYTLMKA